ncbi:MAG: hypothetical protein J5I90_13095 [Caldilineales bacterium]|nr:hypothetical protein [Caldilineales bacterium]
MSPHRAGAFKSPDTEERRIAALTRMLNLAAAGQPLPNRVDLQLRY